MGNAIAEALVARGLVCSIAPDRFIRPEHKGVVRNAGKELARSHCHLDEESTTRSRLEGGVKKIADNLMDQDLETRLRNLERAPRCGAPTRAGIKAANVPLSTVVGAAVCTAD